MNQDQLNQDVAYEGYIVRVPHNPPVNYRLIGTTIGPSLDKGILNASKKSFTNVQ
jgi:hypothetical protein